MAVSLAPELDPVEMLWNHTKYADLANFIPKDVHHLHGTAVTYIGHTRGKGQVFRSFLQHAGLDV